MSDPAPAYAALKQAVEECKAAYKAGRRYMELKAVVEMLERAYVEACERDDAEPCRCKQLEKRARALRLPSYGWWSMVVSR